MQLSALVVVVVFLVSLESCRADNPLIDAVNLARGFDLRNPDDEKQSIFKWDFDQKQTYSYPGTPSVVFSVPDEESVITRSMTIKLASLGLYNKFSSAVDQFSSNYDVEGGKVDNSTFGKADKNIQWIHEKMVAENESCSIAEIYMSRYMASPDSYLFLATTDDFTAAVAGLPDEMTTKEEVETLKTFISNYGTHFFEDGIYGGDIRLVICFHTNLTETHTYSWISEQLDLTYHKIFFDLDHGKYQNQSSIHVDKDFSVASQFILSFTGGSAKLQTPETLLQWQASLDKFDGMVNATVTSMPNLVDDPKKSATLAVAIRKYLKKGDLSLD